uniref:hypothetical protein n=1 Tax=Edaphovirga cremea TaxID=2267246 RepID=UPI003989BD5F
DYTYASLSCYGGTGTYLARTQRKSSQNGVAIEAHDITYFNVDTDDLLTLGRLNTIVYTVYNAAPVGDKTTTSSFDYYLSEDSNTFFTEIEMSTNVDSEMTKHCYERKIYSGKVVYTANITESESAPALTIDITYDGLDRVTKKTACQGSEFEASQSFAYGNINSDDDDEDNATYFRRTSTDANGLQIRTYLNGSGKTLFQKQQDVDGIVGVGLFLQTQQISYDGLGNELSSTNYDYLPGDTATAPSISTITTIQYDVWGAECGTTYPDSHQEIDAHDPTTLTSEGYWLLSDKSTEQYTQTVYNISGSPVSESRLNLDGSIYSTTTTDYDGLGRSVRTTDAQNNVELTSYDAFSRPLTKTLPDGTEVQTTYAPHSKENLTTSIALAKDGDSYTFGTREFDGLSHTTTMSVGGRVTTLEYTANTAMPHPSFVNTPAGDRLKYTYQPELGYATMSIGLETGDGVGAEDEASMTYTYSPASGQPVTANSTKGASEYSNWTYEYLPSGETTSSSLTYALDSGEQGTKQISSTYSLCGLVLVTTDVQMQTHTVTYNGQGQQIGYQLQSGSQSLVEVEYSYDLSGRPSQTVTQDTLSGAVNQTTTISYDDQGRELTRTLSALGSSQSQTLAYSVDDQILTRTWMQDGAAYRTETYDYSVLKQLTSYECTGNAMPDAPDGYVLKEQTIIFDFLGNISTVTSTVTASANPGTDTVNVATYSYDPTDRTQLVSISNDPITDWDITLTYDANGNQTTDEQGRTLVYNSRNQLMSLSEDAQTLGGYNYDAYGFLLSEKVASDADATLLFYLDNQLINEVKGDVASTYVESLSCAVTDSASASTQVQLLGSDQQGSIVQISDASEVTYRIYDPYGYRKV